MTKVHVEYISAGCNRVPHALALKGNKLLYGACNAIIVSQLRNNGQIVAEKTLTGHEGRVNCVRWLDEDSFVTCATDKNIFIWRNFEIEAKLSGHTASVTVVNGLENVIVSASIDSTLKIWKDQTCVQTYTCPKSGFALDVCMIKQSSNQFWIFATFDDNSVKVFAQNGKNENFSVCHTLKGHEDWIQSLDVKHDPNGDVLLASGSQDSFIRVWRFKNITAEQAKEEQRKVKDLALDEDIKAKEIIFQTLENNFHSVSLETVLSGHDDKVFAVQWQNQQLLSASLDKTVILWEQNEDIWMESVRVGEVGGNTLGFLGCQISLDFFIAHSFHGALHFWHKKDSSWQPGVTIGGHYDAVEDLDWDHLGRYLITTSKDQTTRIHALWQSKFWHEIARPQVHGYDLKCLSMMPNHKFASGADEKLVRVFETTRNFLENLSAIDTENDYKEQGDFSAQGASVPSLGLSNKAVMEGDNEPVPEMEKHVKDQFPDFYFKPEFYDKPPAEETLVQNTLWPEIQKIYGHGYEIFSIASSANGLLASACKATQAEHANILIWNTKTWTKCASLENGHTLTVVQMAFSPDDKYLLAVSRDRTLSVWNVTDFSLHFKTDKKTSVHQRIIWACDWCPDSKHFVTVGRDKKCVIWSVEEKAPLCKEPLTMANSATAVAVSPIHHDKTLIVVGLDDGQMYFVFFQDGSWSQPQKIKQGHHKTIKRLKFQPHKGLLLASCGADNLVQLLKISE